MHKKVMGWTFAAVLVFAASCSKKSETPVSPTGSQPGSGAAGPDGSTLKASTPTPQSPINNTQPEVLSLTAGKASGLYDSNAASGYQYEFEIRNTANTATVCASGLTPGGGGASVTWVPPTTCILDFDSPYGWRVRANYQGAPGPWSALAAFRSPVGGYLVGNELFDPLTLGPSKVAVRWNDVTWLEGQGVRLNSKDSFVEYRLQQSCVDCEMSALMTNIGNGSEQWKTKVLSMLQGDGINTTENPFRVTIDKRTGWENQGSRIRYTMRSNGNDAGEPRGGFQNWNRTKTYFWLFEWRAGTSRLRVFDGGKSGNQMENLTADYDAPYAPNPHLVRLGSVGGRSENESNPGTIIWNLWVSPRPRPNLPGDR